jgi:hypothetical protein
LLALLGELAIEIASHLTVTSVQPMDDLYSLWVTCSSMHRICDNLAIGRRMALDQCRRGLGWDDVGDYYTLISSLTQLGNLEDTNGIRGNPQAPAMPRRSHSCHRWRA